MSGQREHVKCSPIITYNEISNCIDWGIFILLYGTQLIEYNEIVADNCVHNCYDGLAGGCWSQPSIHRNNLKANNIAIKNGSYNYNNLSAENNYYYTTDVVYIEDVFIWDKNDESEENQPYVGYVFFEPFRTTPVREAGIE